MMPTPDARPAGETERLAIQTLEEEIGALSSDGFVAANVSSAWRGVRSALAAYREIVAAEARAALLAGAPEVWVATDETGTSRIFSAPPATIAVTLQPFWAGEVSSAITPPGTCARYRLVPDTE